MRLFYSPFTSFLPGPWVHLPKYLVSLEATEALCASNEGVDFLSAGGWRTTFTPAGLCPNSQLYLGLGFSLSSRDATSRNRSLQKLPPLQRWHSDFHSAFCVGAPLPFEPVDAEIQPFLLVPFRGAELTSCTSAATSKSWAIYIYI